MRTIVRLRAFGVFAGLLFLWSCATTPEPSVIVPASELPAEVTMNKDAGRGMWLFVTVRLESGEELPFVVDTGSSWTVFDKSLEPRLGKCLGKMTARSWGAKAELRKYAAPKLYLGGVPLMADKTVHVSDHLAKVSAESQRSVMGVLGMDCLKHYCIQMDFEAGKVRFLKPDQVNAAELGQALPLELESLPFIRQEGFDGGKGTNWWLIDSGFNIDGVLSAPLFDREAREKREATSSRKRTAAGPTNIAQKVFFPECVWDGRSYTNLVLLELTNQGPNAIGLRFLARHLVTFDFPKRTMYLKQKSVGPLAGDTFVAKVDDAIRGPSEFLERLREKGQLPGRSKGDKQTLFCIYHPAGDSNSYTFAFREDGASGTSHYQVGRASSDSPWNLNRTWWTGLERSDGSSIYP